MKKQKEIEILFLTLVIFAIVFPIAEAMNAKNIEGNKRITMYNNNILYVGGSGPGNYSSIQDAIDDASDGDTIFVYDESSPYYEKLQISLKSINLIGENRNTTIIDGMKKSNVIYVNGDNIRISGFTIRNSSKTGSNYCAGIFVYVNSDYVDIIGNNLYNNYFGILFYYSGPHRSLSRLGTCRLSNSVISGNNISDNYIGIDLRYSRCNEICNNTISNNGWGIRLYKSSENKIYLNNFIDNNQNAYNDYSNLWYNPQLIRGNYWDDYNGSDVLLPKGIGDLPYRFPKGGIDRFPLMAPYKGNQVQNNKLNERPTSGQVSRSDAQFCCQGKSVQKCESSSSSLNSFKIGGGKL